MANDELLTMSEIADAASVTLAAASNWRHRYADFPRPHPRRRDRFSASDVEKWLDGRRIAEGDLSGDERTGTTYGDRFRRRMVAAPAVHDVWREVDSIRGVADVALLADVVLGLLWLCRTRPDSWGVIARAGDDRQIVDQLARSLSFVHDAAKTISSSSRGQLSALVRLIDQGRRSEDRGSPQWIVDTFESLYARFAELEGRRGSEFFTPSSPVRLMTELVAPSPGDRVLDPCCGSGQFLASVAAHVAAVYGSQAVPRLAGQAIAERSLRLASLNLGIRGYEADLKQGLALTDDLFAGQKFDIVLTNPPFNLSLGGGYPVDARWRFGVPSEVNANFAWLQHVVARLAVGGRAAVIMVNSAANSTKSKDVATRRAMVDAGVVEGLIALPPGLFASTAIPVTVWLLANTDTGRCREVLFVDATQCGEKLSRTRCVLTSNGIEAITKIYRQWRAGEFRPVPGFAAAATVAEIEQRKYRLTPTAYIPAAPVTGSSVVDVHRLWRDLEELDERSVAIDADVASRISGILQ